MASSDRCARCGGQGWGNWFPDSGICYRCWGTGKEPTHTELKQQAEDPTSAAQLARVLISKAEVVADGIALRTSVDALEEPGPAMLRELERLRTRYRWLKAREQEIRQARAAKRRFHAPELTEDSYAAMVGA